MTGGRVPLSVGVVAQGRAVPCRDASGRLVSGRHTRGRVVPDGHAVGERGAGTVLVLAVAAVVLALALGVGALGSAQRARGSAQAAADLAALAGATAARHGADGCAVAADAVRRNGAELVACDPEPGGVVRVRTARPAVGSDGGPWAGLLGTAHADARAGPRPGGASPG